MGSIVANGGTLPFDYRRVRPVVDLAIKNISYRLAKNMTLRYKYHDHGSSCGVNGVGNLAAKLFYEDNVSIYIGPGNLTVYILLFNGFFHFWYC